jgi:DUF1680 family protein
MKSNDAELTRRRFLAASLTGLTVAGLAGLSESPADARVAVQPAIADALAPPNPADVHLGGYVGAKIDLCMEKRVMAQDIDRLVRPFAEKTEIGDGDWRSEYWGKWFTSAALAYAYEPTPAHRAVIDKAVSALIATRDADGYIGSRNAAHRLQGWDIWGRKYVLLGLIFAYDVTGDPATLAAAAKHADTLLNEVGPGKANIAELGYASWKGLPTSSILEPTVLLYRRTGDKRYLDFARYIVGQWSVPNRLSPNGMRLIEDATRDLPVAEYNAAKAYEMTSCFEGLCELYRVTGDPAYLKAVENYGQNIVRNELFVVGSGSSREIWFGGKALQTHPNPDPMETCVTATWMKYCYQLLRLTGDSRYADQMELSLYNALLGALKPDGTWWGYYIPMQGVKGPSHIQHADVGLSCCVASGPRALMLTPQWAVMRGGDGPVVNLYNPGSATVGLVSGNRVKIEQETGYPQTGGVRLTVHADHSETFALSLRIPAWSEKTTLTVNGKPYDTKLTPGTYAAIRRRWGKSDIVELTLDLRGRVSPDPGGSDQVAVTRGPIVLAYDHRLPAPVETTALRFAAEPGGALALAHAEPPAGADVWMTYHAPVTGADGVRGTLTLCDYASAGNTWNRDSAFKVWLNQPLDLDPSVGLSGAKWIWAGGDHGVPSTKYPPALDFPAGTRRFRRVFDLPAGATAVHAALRITADDSFTLFVNGHAAGQGTHWQDVQSADIARYLQPGRNVLAVEATNTEVSPAGLIARLEIRRAGSAPIVIVTDAAWKSSDSADAAWQTPDFDDKGWTSASVSGAFGAAPWGAIE